MLTKLKNGLDGTQLKTIALALMVLDNYGEIEKEGILPLSELPKFLEVLKTKPS